jgi:hypothetical protein
MRISYRLLSLLLLVLTGCGDGRVKLPTAPVAGVVTYQGRPLITGRVAFLHPSGQGAAVSLAADGTFNLIAFQGKNQVAIQSYESDKSNTGSDAGPVGWPVKSLIPTRYAEFSTSGLTIDVNPGNENHARLTLTD